MYKSLRFVRAKNETEENIVNEYKGIEVFGEFNDVTVHSIIGLDGREWFTMTDIALALDVGKSTISRLRRENVSEFEDGDVDMITIDGKNQLVFSEEGFMTICDLSKSKMAYRLRRWVRKQFRVRRDEALGIVVYPKAVERDDLSDVEPELAMVQHMLDNIIEDRRRIRALETSGEVIRERQDKLTERVFNAEQKIQAFEDQNVISPGEMTALQLARHVRWITVSGGAHNMAVILAAINADFLARRLLRKIPKRGPLGKYVEEYVFTVNGVTTFKKEINANYCTGQKFVIKPNGLAQTLGYKCKRNVEKV